MIDSATQALDPAGVVWVTPNACAVHAPGPRLGRRASFVGVIVSMVIAAIPAVIGLVEPDLGGALILTVFGTPAAGLVAWRLAPTIRNGDKDEAFGRAIAMGFATFFLAVALCSVVLAIGSIASPNATGSDRPGIVLMAAGAIVLTILGWVVASPGIMVTIPSAMAWVFIMRRLPWRLLGSVA